MAKTANYLRQTSLNEHQLNLVFKYPIGNVKHFTIKGNGIVKHVYDIENTSLPSTQNIGQYKAKGVQAFRIAQYNKKVLRVVIEATRYMKGSFEIKGRKLTLLLPMAKGSIKKQVTYKKHVEQKVKKNSRKNTQKSYRYNSKRKYKTIILDAGHGGRDVGASSKHVREKDLTLSMTLKLKNILQKMGYKVLLTRTKDKFMNLKQRTDYVYNRKGSIFVSIHANAAPKKRTKGVRYEGMEVFYLSLKNSKRISKTRAVYRGRKVYSKSSYRKMVSSWKFSQSKALAHLVRKNVLSNVGREYKIYDKGIKRKDFWVLLATKMPSILVETGYLTNKDEVKKLKDSHYQTLLMEGIANGINRYYGLL
ncbi:MAG: N-acetylmuramoyl-L-alanine amidase (EC [uncultured Sulfurovum sp.]|uniref:N-acetylmuramoyl-L-alanine amidase n=1 Tax=uncultured Sulfurovum sp. TaxID=269237 RepID=A0A6S6SCH7_9BACT|nr:MAG: N-acetylmuramoyl-L-alanine amidase (EC [uncultured Sulfurovum sp.]